MNGDDTLRAAALLRRRQGAGPALIVSPLLARMRDQVAAAARAGVRAATITSANATDWGAVEEELRAGTVDVLLISPERLVNPRFRAEQLPLLVRSAGLIVIAARAPGQSCPSPWPRPGDGRQRKRFRPLWRPRPGA
jgi:hypothetical protein